MRDFRAEKNPESVRANYLLSDVPAFELGIGLALNSWLLFSAFAEAPTNYNPNLNTDF